MISSEFLLFLLSDLLDFNRLMNKILKLFIEKFNIKDEILYVIEI